MHRIKLNSFASNKNKMAKNFLFIGIVLISFFSRAQSAGNKESVSEKKVVQQTLNQKFAAPVLSAYQENSKTKIEDVFSYFQMLADASLSDDLKKEIVKSINLLFKDPNTSVIDFTSESLDKITLQQFIQKLLISEPILFSVSNATQFNSVDYNSWKIGYTISITKSGTTNSVKVVHKVFFFKTPKVFGDQTKEVLSTILGEMQ